MELTDVRAVVTGGASGMGRTFVTELARAGATVHTADVNADALAALAEETGASTSVADVSSEADVERLFDEAEVAMGSANVLINNAGITRDGLLVKRDRKTGAVVKMPKAHWDAVIAVNLTGPFLCMRRFAERALEHGLPQSVAIQMSSISRAGNPGQTSYSAAKAGLAADTALWAKELGRYGMRVGAIAPGFIRTPMVEAMRPDALEKVLAPVPLRRLGEPEEIWQAVRFIVQCDYFTGRVLEVDGGLTL
ncbi:MAG: SDR family oxidoreductase [Myxococcales bacterium]|nr:SDR family oxidoreductase [Myxococcales bacterium]